MTPTVHQLASDIEHELRQLHRCESTRIDGRSVQVCSTCRSSTVDELAVATSGRELWPCPTLRVARRLIRLRIGA